MSKDDFGQPIIAWRDWIPVTARTPEEKDINADGMWRFWTFCNQAEKKFQCLGLFFPVQMGGPCWTDPQLHELNVTHWMKLPNPPIE